MSKSKDALTLAVEIGYVMLQNGGEIYRVEDTVMKIMEAYELEDHDVYVLSNGLFASANEGGADAGPGEAGRRDRRLDAVMIMGMGFHPIPKTH